MPSDQDTASGLSGDDADNVLSVTFESLTFSDGTTVLLNAKDVIVFVGPNNAGKSAALRELERYMEGGHIQTVIATCRSRRTGTTEQFRQFIEQNLEKRESPGSLDYVGLGFSFPAAYLNHDWPQVAVMLKPLFCRRLTTEARITDSNPASAIDFSRENPSHPIHLLFRDDRIESKMSGYFRRAFDQDLILDRLGGSVWSLRVGERPKLNETEDRLSFSYNDRLRATSVPLHAQGDGMRSFASVILHLLTQKTPSVLILDEPEAFLHPPQARLLGEVIAKERPKDSQLFIATHSPDVLQGLLNASPNLRVLRIQRQRSINRVKELDKTRANEIASDPVMKFTNVLSGVFHHRVIICEADSDCLFYSSILDLPQVHGEHQPDVLFVQAGGKHRMFTLAEALRALDVRVDVIADIDILQEESVLERLVKALGGDWDAVATKARQLKIAIEQRRPG